ncbi:hypothetical protein V2J09_012649 [Rumex salicifolius]
MKLFTKKKNRTKLACCWENCFVLVVSPSAVRRPSTSNRRHLSSFEVGFHHSPPRSMLLTAVLPTSSFPLPLTHNFHVKRSISTTTSFRVYASGAAKVEYTPWLIVGLGNPGNKYHGTRHNVGFEMVDQISEKEGIVLNTIQSKALIGLGSIGEVPILLAKPQTYMNYIGESVGPLAAYYKVPLRHILLVYDEMNLPNGVLRLQQKGGHGYHSGVKSVMAHLDSRREFPRLCIGIGNPPGTMDMKAFLLQRFSPSERKQINAAMEQGVEAVRTLVLNGFSDSITRFNLTQKYKYHKICSKDFALSSLTTFQQLTIINLASMKEQIVRIQLIQIADQISKTLQLQLYGNSNFSHISYVSCYLEILIMHK